MTAEAVSHDSFNPEEVRRQQNQVIRVITAVRRRCNLNAAVMTGGRWAFRGVLGALLIEVVLKLLGVTGWSMRVVAAALVVAVTAAIVEFSRRRITLRAASMRGDEVLGLKERLSSALELSIEHKADNEKEAAWDALLLASAYRAVGGIRISHHFPVVLPKEARWLWCPAAMLVASVIFLPAMHLWPGSSSEAQAMTLIPMEELDPDTIELSKMAERLRLEQQDKKEKVSDTAKLVTEIDDLSQEMRSGKLDKREALSQLASLTDKIRERRDALARSPEVSKLPARMAPQDMQYMGNASEKLAAQQFDDAAKALAQIEDRLRGGLSESKADQLSKELSALAEQLDANSDLSKALKQAAADLKAGSMGSAQMGLQAAQLALADLQDLKRQMDMLDRAMQAVASSQLKLSGSASMCSSCGQRLSAAMLKAGLCSNCGGSCSGLGMSRFAKSGPWRPGATNRKGNGLGGPGQGRGGQMPFAEGGFKLEDSMVPGKMGDGQILGSFLVEGPPTEGQSTVQFRSAVEVAKQRGEEAMEKDLVPLAYRQRVRQYFYTLQTPKASEDATPSDADASSGESSGS